MHFIANPTFAQTSKFNSGKLHWDQKLKYFNTKSNFLDSGSSFKNLDPGHSYNYLKLLERFDFNYSNTVNFFSQLEIGNSQSDDGSYIRNYSSINSLALGFQYYLRLNKKWILLPELSTSFSLYKIEKNTDNSFSSDGANTLLAGMAIQRRIYSTINELFLGYLYRDQGLSHLIQYRYLLRFRLSKSFSALLSMNGYSTFYDDEFINSPTTRTNIIENVNGGSLSFYSVNPSSHGFSIGSEIQLTRHSSLGFHVDSVYAGRNTAKGETFIVDLKFKNLLNLYNEKGLKRQKSREQINTFKADYEEYDEELFEVDDLPKNQEDSEESDTP